MRNFITDTGLPGTIPTQSAGVNAGATPKWKILGTESWDTDKFSLTLTERWFSAGVFSNEYVVCQTSCPVSTVNNPTVDYNHMPGALYVDIGGSYNITNKFTMYARIDNLLNHDPASSPQTNTGIDVNPQLYDVIGRMYRIGIRYNF